MSTKRKIIECVPNFSEGKDKNIIDQITGSLGKEVTLVDVSMGESTNRTVVTIIGEPQYMIEAAFRAIRKAKELIDMRYHSGEHPRFGASDVVPFVPVQNVTMEECVEYSRELAAKVGNELGIPVYCYESAAFTPKRKNLSVIREGEYEKLSEKLKNPEWKPDFGPCEFTESVQKSGVTVIGARNFLIAVNFNLNTTSTRRANAVAFDCREAGRVQRAPNFGEIIRDPETNEAIRDPGSCPGTKAIGWYIGEYECCQVSMNICDIQQTPLHVAYENVVKSAFSRGMFVNGTEIVGLVPLSVLLQAGEYFLKKQKRSLGVPQNHLIDIAIKSMGLSQVKKFRREQQIVEFNLPKEETPLADKTITEFCYETASEKPAPGGGSVAALVGGLAAALATMVGNLSSHKRGWDEKWEFFSKYAERGIMITNELVGYIDEDTTSFMKVMECFKIPKTQKDRQLRINKATRGAIEVPLNVMKSIRKTFEILEVMSKEGMSSSISDVGVGAACALAGMKGAYLNVMINLKELKGYEEEKEFISKISLEAESLLRDAFEFEKKMWLEISGKVKE